MKKCKECGRSQLESAGEFVINVVLIFIGAWIVWLSANHLMPKYAHWAEIPYWDVVAGLFLLRATLGAIVVSIKS